MPSLVLAFQLLVIATCAAAMILVRENDKLIGLRLEVRHRVDSCLKFQRHMRFLEAISLCVAVLFGAIQSWEPWPPIVLYVVVRLVTLSSQVIAVRRETEQLMRVRRWGLQGRGVQQL